MGYYTFLYWFSWRLFMALLAHANWSAAVYVKCVYFVLWKSYDLLWFWMHLILCICFEPLRSENYLLVWCVIMYKKCTTDKNRSFRQIYQATYSKRFTKSERELKKIETIELAEDSDDEDDRSDPGSIYPRISTDSDQPRSSKVNFTERLESEGLMGNEKKPEKKGILKKIKIPDVVKNRFSNISNGSSTPENDGKDKKFQLQKLLPQALQKTEEEAESEREEKRRKKEEKLRLREIRQRRKEYLKEQAKIERRRRLISDSIDILLQCLRLFTSFAILVGNIHRNFVPKYLRDESEHLNNPEVMMAFTLTMTLDILLFWISTAMTYFKQCRLCCRLGLFKFWLWLAALFFLGGVCMYYPMHLAHPQMSLNWCQFEPGTPIGDFLNDGKIFDDD
ncbi:unnamed protein product [Bursaphelenchus xylophilus]|uniref:(pine wood nematode) hypothetical protein n=1 Tax=Bursaphelenchus xylophilus TaxID=6326 RepID=A0A1I7RKM5_BURXY|nr:unnamed protein product [Bursaphelenchus xylophilus]CAG9131224.1 unnamed protein product [Bursaphelenchus xylophilus]